MEPAEPAHPGEPGPVLSATQQQGATRALMGALEFTALSRNEVELNYLAIGGSHPQHVGPYLRGERALSAYEYNVLAQVFNDEFTAAGQDHPVPYADQLPTADPPAG